MSVWKSIGRGVRAGLALAALAGLTGTATAQNFVPGTGTKLTQVGDDMEDPNWKWVHNFPKSSRNIDKNGRFPLGGSTNGRWVESAFRGHMDFIQRVETPAGGIPGSKGSLMIRTLNSGVPGVRTAESQQDDLLLNVSSRVGGMISVSSEPSCVVRVYIPPFNEWDPNTDTSLGIRGALKTTKTSQKRLGLFGLSRTVRESEEYWPGFFIQFRSKADGGAPEDQAMILIRSNPSGNDMFAKQIKDTGWWTFGMSFSSDGQVHYYASPGVDDLTASDHLTSQFPYSYKAEQFNTLFFNVVSRNDGKNWSTPWILDDPSIYTRNGIRR